jgi:hypothetical protein
VIPDAIATREVEMTQEKPQTPRPARQVEDLPVRAERVSEGKKVHVEQSRGVGLEETRNASEQKPGGDRQCDHAL